THTHRINQTQGSCEFITILIGLVQINPSYHVTSSVCTFGPLAGRPRCGQSSCLSPCRRRTAPDPSSQNRGVGTLLNATRLSMPVTTAPRIGDANLFLGHRHNLVTLAGGI